MRHFRLYMFGALVVFAVGMFAWFQYDLAAHYTRVQGQISETVTLCRLEKTDQYIVARTEHKTNAVSCDMAQAAVQPGQKFEGYKIVPQTEIHWDYVSPVDNAHHAGQTERDGDRSRWPAPGSTVTIYAHKTQADLSKFVT